MDISGVSPNGLVMVAQALQGQKLQQDVATAVTRIANDQVRAEGELALELIAASSGIGQNLDVRA